MTHSNPQDLLTYIEVKRQALVKKLNDTAGNQRIVVTVHIYHDTEHDTAALAEAAQQMGWKRGRSDKTAWFTTGTVEEGQGETTVFTPSQHRG